jgi:two-component system, OmpR family, sensor histidine kinase KdpD
VRFYEFFMVSTLESRSVAKMPTKTIRDVAIRIVIGVAASLLTTWIAFQLHFNLSSATSVHLFLVTVVALRWGFLEASIVSLLSVACLDYFFTQPLFAFYMSDSHDWVALGTFEGVALLVSRLSNQVGLHVRESEMHRSQLQKLYELSQNILLLDPQKPIDQQLANLIQSTLKVKGVALWNAYDLRLCKSGDCDAAEDEVRSVYFMEASHDDAAAATSWRVLHLSTKPIGSLVICGHSLDTESINAAVSLTAVAIERARSFAAESSAEAARQSEQLRSAVLDGLAHAFKTPLTTIRSSSSGLLEMDTLSGTEKRLITLIDRQAGHLNDLTTHMLRTAKLDNVDLRAKREHVDLRELIQRSIEASLQELGGHPVNVQPMMLGQTVWADPQLLKMALHQLFDNAAKYGTSGSAIAVDVQEEQSEILISVHNEGSFIPFEERSKIFQRFYRCPGSDRRASGTGIGLSVVKRITEAHQGRAWVNSDRTAGTTVFLTLPRSAKEK